jgi:prolyl oligopeptidase
MTRLVAEALADLLLTEWHLRRHKNRMLSGVLKGLPPAPNGMSRYTPEQICRAMDIACVAYFKVVLCLQRSVATTMLLRRHGFQAELVIGTKIALCKFHAWVEIDGAVMNDKAYVPQLYLELERC